MTEYTRPGITMIIWQSIPTSPDLLVWYITDSICKIKEICSPFTQLGNALVPLSAECLCTLVYTRWENIFNYARLDRDYILRIKTTHQNYSRNCVHTSCKHTQLWLDWMLCIDWGCFSYSSAEVQFYTICVVNVWWGESPFSHMNVLIYAWLCHFLQYSWCLGKDMPCTKYTHQWIKEISLKVKTRMLWEP